VTPRFLLYGRRNCHLCHELASQLQSLEDEFDFDLEVVDVDSDPALQHRYGARAPVLVCGQAELMELRMETSALRRLVQEATATEHGA